MNIEALVTILETRLVGKQVCEVEVRRLTDLGGVEVRGERRVPARGQ